MVERQEDQFHQIEIGVVVPALICVPIWLAEERGFLADERLRVRLRGFGTTEGTTAGAISYDVTRSGADITSIRPPRGKRPGPGWDPAAMPVWRSGGGA